MNSVLTALTVLALVAALGVLGLYVTGDVTGDRAFWGFIGCAILAGAADSYRRKENKAAAKKKSAA
jgi:hypothetical protein